MSAVLSHEIRAHATQRSSPAIKVGTRGSPLALRQTHLVVTALAAAGHCARFEIEAITTSGDRILDRQLAEVGGKGLFAKELDTALLDGRIDFAVHSLKDLETTLPSGIVLACVLPRADPRDALVLAPDRAPHNGTLPLPMLPIGARIGTASARRQAQLLHLRPDLYVGLIRGNVQTRIGHLGGHGFAATLLAIAGIHRLGLDARLSILPPELMVPAACQGIIGVTVRDGDHRAIELLSRINDRLTWVMAQAERALLRALDGSCRTPIGAYATPLPGNELLLTGMVARPDGSFLLKRWRRGGMSDAAALAMELGRSLRTDSPMDLFT